MKFIAIIQCAAYFYAEYQKRDSYGGGEQWIFASRKEIQNEG
jgi:hypothetical protein